MPACRTSPGISLISVRLFDCALRKLSLGEPPSRLPEACRGAGEGLLPPQPSDWCSWRAIGRSASGGGSAR
eukprot:6982656-Alexandrium_andersonii.AAC.1